MTTPLAWYNENDDFAADWLEKLIAAGAIAPGVVDRRSIEDVLPSDLVDFTQCHFFAGIGVWSYAARRAGWRDDRPLWTGSCPCQPFSQAGKGEGFADERHLWPAWNHLIEICRPPVVLGEQVASPDGLEWVDLVQSDFEGSDYAFGAQDRSSAGNGAPEIRQRLYFGAASRVAHADYPRLEGWSEPERQRRAERLAGPGSLVGGMAYADQIQRTGLPNHAAGLFDGPTTGWIEGNGQPERGRPVRQVAGGLERAGPTNGFWRDADWLFCRDGSWRPVEPGTFPLVDGSPSDMGQLRAYGNALDAQNAQGFIEDFDFSLDRAFRRDEEEL